MKNHYLIGFVIIIVVTLCSLFYSSLNVTNVRNKSNQLKNNELTLNIEASKGSEIIVNCNLTKAAAKKNTDDDNDDYIDYLHKYPHFLSCKTNYNIWSKETSNEANTKYDYSTPADVIYHSVRVTRAVLVYFPIESIDHFTSEFKWLYRSWIYMLKFEPPMWRTDLIVFIENDTNVFNKSGFFLSELNCKFGNVRRGAEDKPMCTLINYKALKNRVFTTADKSFDSVNDKYRYLLKDVDIFKTDSVEFDTFYKTLKSSLSSYGYLDSILMAFEGYEYFKNAGYDFLVRSDMDVFLTPLFATWLPRHCNDFCVGRGGYSTTFNANKFARIAQNLKLKYAGEQNLGSTWYSTPAQFRLVAYLTLFGMAYLSSEEFSQTEREGKLGVLLWPDWHYGVLLLYGQTLALNHLIASKQANVLKLEDHLDYPSGNTHSIHKVLNIHVFHGDDMFSKFAFKMGKYDNMNTTESDEIKLYALKMALEGKRLTSTQLNTMLVEQIANKT